jgi:hypothetical protein
MDELWENWKVRAQYLTKLESVVPATQTMATNPKKASWPFLSPVP